MRSLGCMKVDAILAIALLTCAATLATVWVPRPVHSREELRNHWLGYPITFLRQDLGRFDPETFPEYFRFDPPWHSGGFFLDEGRFLASWAIVLGGTITVVWLTNAAIRRIRRR
jgi:hypothetical protein